MNQFIQDLKINTIWRGLIEDINVDITLPDINSLDYDSQGDWGAHYHFKIPAATPIQVEYTSSESNQSRVSIIEQSTLVLKSPMKHSDRNKFRFESIIQDRETGLEIQLKIDHEGNTSATLNRITSSQRGQS